jgi:hypothetical protein
MSSSTSGGTMYLEFQVVFHRIIHMRSNLDTKDCASFAGIIKLGRNMTSMMNNEFPRLIYVNSIERTEVERNFPILDA